MRIVNNLLIFFFITNLIPSVNGQYLNIINGVDISNMVGDESNAQWSADNKSLLFQSKINENNILCIYYIELDTLLCFSDLDYNINNPVWYPFGNQIVFDSDKSGFDFLYILDIKTKVIKPLFDRKIRCRNPSFSGSSRQVYFSGFDELNKCWEIYSYDFIYDNLNKLTDYKLGCSNPQISNDGKLIAYCKENPFKGTKNINVINWYGEPEKNFTEFEGESAIWNPSGFKLFFISKMDSKNGELYSIWKDGTHLERLTNDTIEMQQFAISPDETKIAISVLTISGWDIYILPVDSY